MPDHFLNSSEQDRRDALAVAADRSGRPAHLLEKDVWVVWALQVLFRSPHAEHLVFKGGTSLSKAYNAIQRFSEDIDLTYDIRALIPNLAGDTNDPLPPNPSQAKKWTKAVRERLPIWVKGEIAPLISESISQGGMSATVEVTDDHLFIHYDPLEKGTGYVPPSVQLDFGARSTGEPSQVIPITCDAAPHIDTLLFPEVSPKVMRAERTFWEKATAIHVFCQSGAFRGGARFSRHWYDIVRLDDTGYAEAAITDREIALSVAAHKSAFFVEKDTGGIVIDYAKAVTGDLTLVPNAAALEVLENDFKQMIEDRLLLDDVESFSDLMERCQSIQDRINSL